MRSTFDRFQHCDHRQQNKPLSRDSYRRILLSMPFAPRQNWNAFNDAMQDHRVLSHSSDSTLTELPSLEAAFFRYASYFDAIQLARRELHQAANLDLSHERQTRWSEKLKSRRRLLAVYQAMDLRRDE